MFSGERENTQWGQRECVVGRENAQWGQRECLVGNG